MPRRKKPSVTKKQIAPEVGQDSDIVDLHLEQKADDAAKRKAANTAARCLARQDPQIAERDRIVKNTSQRKIRAKQRVPEVGEDPNIVIVPEVGQNSDIVDLDSDSEPKAANAAYRKAANTAARRQARHDSQIVERDRIVKNTSQRKVRAQQRLPDVGQYPNIVTVPKVGQTTDIVDHDSEQKAANAAKRKASDTATRREARQDPQIAERDCIVKNTSQRKIRADEKRRQKEKASQGIAKHAANYCTPEKKEENERIRQRMTNSDRKKEVQAKNTDLQRIKRKLFLSSYENQLHKYKDKIRQSPSYICSCCGSLWYKESTAETSKEALRKSGLEDNIIETILHVHQEVHRLCSTCRRYVAKGSVPRLYLSKGFDFPVIPEPLQNSSPLEERLVALRIPFMQIRPLGFEKQSALRGNVVNVDNDLDICAQVLPRSFSETSTVQVQFMRRMNYKHPYMYEIIRCHKVYLAAKCLMTTELYQSENVVLSEDWSGFTDDVTMDFIAEENESTVVTATNGDQDGIVDEAAEFDVPDSVNNVGAEETLVFDEKDIRGIRIAPGEGHVPKHLHFDVNAEVMSFPTIYCGQIRNFNKNIIY